MFLNNEKAVKNIKRFMAKFYIPSMNCSLGKGEWELIDFQEGYTEYRINPESKNYQFKNNSL